MSDRIEIRDLRVTGTHGVLPEERDRAQPFSVDIVAWVDMEAAQQSDDLADTVDYGALAQAAADQRIQALRTELHIADTQLPQWNAFAQVMRDNATKTDALFRQRASAAASMNALDNMKSYADIARAYADNTQALATAFEALYGVLTVQQKQTIDTMFRQDATKTAAQQTRG